MTITNAYSVKSRSLRFSFILVLLLCGLSTVGRVWSQDETPERAKVQAAQDSASTSADKPVPVTHYMGREIAPTMSYAHGGADWLQREEREAEERCSLLLANLGLRPGMTVCDLGCGNGFYTLRMAKRIGDGQVLAVDIQPEMLADMRQRLEAESIENVTPILGSVYDPRLPNESVDLVLLVDVYHEFSYPQEMLAKIRAALKPDGRAVFVEYRAEDPDIPIRPLHKMTRAQVIKELNANRFQLVSEFNDLPWQHVMFFGRDDAKK